MVKIIKLTLVSTIIASSIFAAPKWINPSEKICIQNDGVLTKDGTCESTWTNASSICTSLGSKLPKEEIFLEVVTSCGGILGQPDKNRKNHSYQSCYKKKGFKAVSYWSSSPIERDPQAAMFLNFSNGGDSLSSMEGTHSIRCVRDNK